MYKETKPQVRVAIIGGGASGWASAEVLNESRWEGRFNVVIFEKNSYFGGKCRTIFPDGEICNGKPGGYELGAGVISKGSKSSADLEKYMEKYNIPYSNIEEKSRYKRRYFVNGQKVNRQIFMRLLIREPTMLLRAIYGLFKYWLDLGRYSKNARLDYSDLPSNLNRNFSAKYPLETNVCFAFGMQCFGFADMDDPQLTPPLIYYHQYITRDVLKNPLYKVNIGMQGIWSTIAAHYPENSKRLNTEVLAVKRETSHVVVETSEGKEYFDYLIVATPLGRGLGFMDFNSREKALISRVKSNHYVSVLCRVSGLHDIGNVNVENSVNRENIGRIMFVYKRYEDSDWVSINLYLENQDDITDEKVIDIVSQGLKEDFSAALLDPSSAKVFHWRDYFSHLSTADLDECWYKKFEDLIQGKKRTLFVSSGLHMETVGASVQYATEKVEKIAMNWINN